MALTDHLVASFIQLLDGIGMSCHFCLECLVLLDLSLQQEIKQHLVHDKSAILALKTYLLNKLKIFNHSFQLSTGLQNNRYSVLSNCHVVQSTLLYTSD